MAHSVAPLPRQWPTPLDAAPDRKLCLARRRRNPGLVLFKFIMFSVSGSAFVLASRHQKHLDLNSVSRRRGLGYLPHQVRWRVLAMPSRRGGTTHKIGSEARDLIRLLMRQPGGVLEPRVREDTGVRPGRQAALTNSRTKPKHDFGVLDPGNVPGGRRGIGTPSS